MLFIDGDPEVLNRFQIAVVGSRKPSSIGEKTASDFARNLSDAGLVVTSGMALGIDAAGHYGALKGASPTIAVLGTGLDEIYPKRHQRLAEKIRERGALVSEFPATIAESRAPRHQHQQRESSPVRVANAGFL